MILSDRHIRERLLRGDLAVEPDGNANVQPASLDVRLGSSFRVFTNHRHTCIDPYLPQPDLTDPVDVGSDGTFVLHPGEFVLATTLEQVTMPDDLVAHVDGKSSLGRLGLLVHATAGIIDPGFVGQITLELSNVATLPIILRPGMPVAQLLFSQMSGPAQVPYGAPGLGSRYQGQQGATASRFSTDRQPARVQGGQAGACGIS